MKGWKKIFQINGNLKKAEVMILISDKMGFKTQTVRTEEGHYIVLKCLIHQENI